MRIPNPFASVLTVLVWPVNRIARLFVSAIWFQKLTLEKMAALGCEQTVIDKMADTYNQVNAQAGKNVIFRTAPIAAAAPLEKSRTSRKAGEAKP